MTFKWRRRVHRHAIWPLLAISLISACGGGGGGILAVLQIVTPLGGDWLVDPNSDDQKLDFNANPNTVILFESSLNVAATVTTTDNVCGGGFTGGIEVDVEGTLENGDLVLRRINPPNNTSTCLEGTFTDLITLEAGPPGEARLAYKNGRVDVQMQLGLWVSGGNNPLKFKFSVPPSVTNGEVTADALGCDLSANPVVNFIGKMHGFDTNTNSKPLMLELRSNDNNDFLLFSQIVFEDGATLTLLDSQGNPVTLHRQPDNPETKCPPL